MTCPSKPGIECELGKQAFELAYGWMSNIYENMLVDTVLIMTSKIAYKKMENMGVKEYKTRKNNLGYQYKMYRKIIISLKNKLNH